MNQVNRWGLAAGLAAAIAFAPSARAQQSGSGGMNPPSTSGSSASEPSSASPGAKSSDSSPSSATSSGTGTSATGTESSATSATGKSATGQAGQLKKSLTDGLAKLHADHEAEIQMGQMGVQMAQNDQVKEFAQKIVDDHTKGDQTLTQWAQQQGIDLTTSKAYEDEQKEAQKHMQRAHNKTGADFDKEFMSGMVKDHQKDVKDVKKLADEARKESQAELASMLDQTHTAMQGHLDQAKQVEKVAKSEPKGSSTKRQGRTPGTSGGTGSTGGSASSPGTSTPSPTPDSGTGK